MVRRTESHWVYTCDDWRIKKIGSEHCFKISCHVLFPIPNLFRILASSAHGMSYKKKVSAGISTEAPPRWNRFFQQLADPKTALQPLTEMHLPLFKNEECHCRSRPLAPNFNVAGSSRNKAIIQTERPTHTRKATTLKLGGAWEGLSSKPTYITMLAPHYLSIV